MMAKQKTTPGRAGSQGPSGSNRSASSRFARKWIIAAVVTLVVVAGCALAAYKALPDGLPWLGQRLLGLTCAALAALTIALTARQSELPDEMGARVRRGQHLDFGRVLRMAHAEGETVKLPVIGEIQTRTLAGCAVFVLVGAWWMSPWTPVAVRQVVFEDLSVPLTEEILAVVLVMPNTYTAVLQPPIIPPRAVELAARVDRDAGPCELARKAMAEGRFQDARALLQTAEQTGDLPPAEICTVRGQNELYAGRFTDAADWYDKALKEKPEDPTLLCQAAVARMLLGDFTKAEQLLSDAVKTFAQKAEEARKKDPAYAACLHLRSVVLLGLGKEFDAAEEDCYYAREIFETAILRKHPFMAASFNNHAVLYLLHGKYASVEQLLGQAAGEWDKWTEGAGGNHPHLATRLGNLAMLYCIQARYDEANELLEKASAIRAESLPDDHPLLAVGRSARLVPSLAPAQTVEQYQEAQRAGEEALAFAREAFGEENPVVAAVFDSLATIYARQARYAKAEDHYVRAQAITERYWGRNHPYLAEVINHRTRLDVDRARHGQANTLDDAEKLCQQVLDLCQRTLGEEHPSAAEALNLRTRVKIERGRYTLPDDLEKALGIYEKTLGKEHPDVARTLGNLAALKNSPYTFEQGAQDYKKAIGIAKKFFGDDHPEVARLWFDLATLYLRQGENEKSRAADCLEESLKIQQKALVPYHPDLAATLETLGPLLAEKDPQRSKEMEVQAKAIRTKHAEVDVVGSG